jgi:hypothetical protein
MPSDLYRVETTRYVAVISRHFGEALPAEHPMRVTGPWFFGTTGWAAGLPR